MERVRKRDADAFEALYDAYHRLAYGLAMRMLGDASTAEDVTQAVFVKVWSSPELFRTGNFGAWIARVTRNRALDVIRSRTVRAETDLRKRFPNPRASKIRLSRGSIGSSCARRSPRCRTSSAGRSRWASSRA